MRKVTFLTFHVLFAFFFLTCNKSDDTAVADKGKKLIAEAKEYFNAAILHGNLPFNQNGGVPNIRQAIGKTPLWEDAYVKSNSKNIDFVVIPIQYDKKLSYRIKSPDTQTLSLECESYLYIYKTASGYHVEVVTQFPDEDYFNANCVKFSGVIVIEDWAGNSIRNYRFKNDEISLVKFTSRPADQMPIYGDGNTDTYCYVRDWYMCSVDSYGNPYDCVYEYTEVLGCYEEIRHDELEGDDIGGGIYVETDYAFTRTSIFIWEFWRLTPEQGGGNVHVEHAVVGKFYKNHPEKNKFLGGYYTGRIFRGTLGSTTFSANDSYVTVAPPQQANIFYDGTFIFADLTKLRVTNTLHKQFSEVNWPL